MARRRLIEHRHQAGLSQEQLAEEVGVSVRMIRSYEDGTSEPRQANRLKLASVLDLTGAELTFALTDDEHHAVNGHAVPPWLNHLGSLEQAAGGIATFEPVVVPGLLQTEEYAFAVERFGPDPVSDDDLAFKVSNRLDRQTVLDKDGFHLCAVIDESVLHRIAQDSEVMAGQLDRLAEVADHPAVELHVLPLHAGVFSAAFGAFTLFTSPGSVNPFMACTEDRSGPHYLDRPPELAAHVNLFAYLVERALSPRASVDAIHAAIKEYR